MPIHNLLRSIPKRPGIYALCAGRETRYVAYVGKAGNLQSRVEQHLIRRDSSIVTGASAVSLNPDKVTAVQWWLHDAFPEHLGEAESVAFEILNPVLRSRTKPTIATLPDAELEVLRRTMGALFRGSPSGEILVPSIASLIARIERLEQAAAEWRVQRNGGTRHLRGEDSAPGSTERMGARLPAGDD